METKNMTLNTDSRKVKKPMDEGLDYQIGMALVFLGISSVHEKLIPELKLRTDLANALHSHNPKGRPILKDRKVISDHLIWEDYIGFTANVAFEMRSAWFNRMLKYNAPKPLTKKELKEIGV